MSMEDLVMQRKYRAILLFWTIVPDALGGKELLRKVGGGRASNIKNTQHELRGER